MFYSMFYYLLWFTGNVGGSESEACVEGGEDGQGTSPQIPPVQPKV
jgi:hypothetical protein